MSIQVTGTEAVTREISRIMKTVTGPEMRYRVAMAGSPYVLQAYKPLTYPNKARREIHNFYGTKVVRGNWQKSVEELSQRRRRLKVAGVAIVGPRYNRRSKSARVVGRTEKSAWANYAHMIYGSARAYEQRITLKALQASAPTALPAMLAESVKIFNQATGRI